MIDFHSHILPNIDDGSRSIEETINLIKEAKEVGFDEIVLTSHYIENYYETAKEERRILINAISEQLKNNEIDVNIYMANEIYITNNIMQLLIDRKATTINDSSYVLFEMPLNLNQEPMNMYDVIYSLQENKLIPVLAHPERYTFVHKDPNIIYDLIQKGVFMQVNYGSIVGQYGEKIQMIAKKMLENNMVHFLGSDVHRQNTIYPKIPQALSIIEQIVGKEKLEELTTINPRLAINNKKIEIDEPQKIELTFLEKSSVLVSMAKKRLSNFKNKYKGED